MLLRLQRHCWLGVSGTKSPNSQLREHVLGAGTVVDRRHDETDVKKAIRYSMHKIPEFS